MRLLSLLWLICAGLCGQAQSTNPTRVNADDFERQLQGHDIQILDVRTSQEFNSGHIANAMQADWNDRSQFTDRVQYIDKNKPVFIYCLAGGRSTAASEWMRQNGFKNVIELEGGINSWKKAGKPLQGMIAKKQITVAAYNDSIAKDKTILVDVGATWCAPCRTMEPILEALQKDKNLHFDLMRIDADVHIDLLKELDVTTIPVFIIYKNGKQVWRKQGTVSLEDIKAALR